MSVASRVAQEQGVKLGHEVGYHIRFEDCTPVYKPRVRHRFEVEPSPLAGVTERVPPDIIQQHAGLVVSRLEGESSPLRCTGTSRRRVIFDFGAGLEVLVSVE